MPEQGQGSAKTAQTRLKTFFNFISGFACGWWQTLAYRCFVLSVDLMVAYAHVPENHRGI